MRATPSLSLDAFHDKTIKKEDILNYLQYV